MNSETIDIVKKCLGQHKNLIMVHQTIFADSWSIFNSRLIIINNNIKQ